MHPDNPSKPTKQNDNSLARAGLPGSLPQVDDALRKSGIDPERLSILKFGRLPHLLGMPIPNWLKRYILALALWLTSEIIQHSLGQAPEWIGAALSLSIGLLILQAACEALITATERLAARFQWNHYTAGTVAEIISTTPELLVIGFLIPVSPVTAFVIALITIYNNALVFSLYSFFLPKDKRGKFVMPTPITEAGTQILIGGGAMGLTLGLVMMALSVSNQVKTGFSPADLFFISTILLIIFCVYLYKLVTRYAQEEAQVREELNMSAADIEQRLELIYENVGSSSFFTIFLLFICGIIGALVGGESVSKFAATMIKELEVNTIVTALILAIFAGMSEYVILWQSHKKKEYGIALANAFGGITQVMFLVLPFTLLGIAFYQQFINPLHDQLPLDFSLSNIFLLIFLFPTFYTLSSLLEEDHTLGLLDTTIMSGIFLFLIVLLVSHGSWST